MHFFDLAEEANMVANMNNTTSTKLTSDKYLFVSFDQTM